MYVKCVYTVFVWFDVTSEAILKSLYCTTSTLPVSFLNKINITNIAC